MLELIQGWFLEQGVGVETADFAARGLAFIGVIILSIMANFVVKRLILAGLRYSILHTHTKWDDILLERKVLDRLANIAPAVVIYALTPSVLAEYGQLTTFVAGVALVYMIVIGVLVLDSLLNVGVDIYYLRRDGDNVPITGFVQAVKLILYFLGIILIISVIIGRTPLYIFSGLGALTAVLMLIFKDPILGFVAGIQLTANKMLARGDWIEMPRYDADGDVFEIALTTVKVRNWDKTITTIPTYALITESFRNWRGMQESGGRRIKRSIYIDLNTIQFCTAEMLERFSRIQYVSDYIAGKKEEVAQTNGGDGSAPVQEDESVVTGKLLTNAGLFRAYVLEYLKHHPQINQEMTVMVRSLAPTEHGLPIEVYAFSKDKVWANYEAIQAEIFDHIVAVVPEFDLKIFQNPAGSDMRHFVNVAA